MSGRKQQRQDLKSKSSRMADLFLKGATVLNVYSGELLRMNVATKGDKILYVGPLSECVGEDTTVLDVRERFLVPGYIEPHCHPWVLYNPLSFGQEAVRFGTTTFVCDNLFFYLLMGLKKFESFMEGISDMPVKFYWTCRTAPQSPMAHEDALYSIDNLRDLLQNAHIASLGEITRWQEMLQGDDKLRELIGIAKNLGKRVDAHTAGAKYERLNVLSWSGMESCHESINGQQLLDRVRLGLYVMLRHSSLRPDLPELVKTIVSKGLSMDRMMLTTDGSTAGFHQEFGMNDNLIKIAIQGGIDPVSAYRMATINPATYFHMDGDVGGIAPGRFADILVLKNLDTPTPEMVISRGRMAVKNGASVEQFPHIRWKTFFPQSCFTERSWKAKSEDFRIPSDGCSLRFPVINLVSAVITGIEWRDFSIRDGFLRVDGGKGLSLISLVDKDGRWVTNGIIRGFADKVEGFASSYNSATEILAIGNDPEAMSAAVNRVIELRGGIVAFEGGKIAYELRLPLGGMMSDASMSTLAEKERELKEYLKGKGHPYHDPLYTFTFLPNDFLPDVRINYDGIVDIKEKKTLWNRRDLVHT
jgi:adenine deaminase